MKVTVKKSTTTKNPQANLQVSGPFSVSQDIQILPNNTALQHRSVSLGWPFSTREQLPKDAVFYRRTAPQGCRFLPEDSSPRMPFSTGGQLPKDAIFYQRTAPQGCHFLPENSSPRMPFSTGEQLPKDAVF